MEVNRRAALAGLGLSLSTAVAGCFDAIQRRVPVAGDQATEPAEGPVRVTGTEPRIAPGGETPLVVEATEVTTVRISPAGADEIAFDFDGSRSFPSATMTYPSYPPVWEWRTRSAVRIELPIVAGADAKPGEYEYDVHASLDRASGTSDDSENGLVTENAESMTASSTPEGSTTETFAITVVENDLPWR